MTHLVEPDIAIISNVGTAHLENLGTMENIAKAKVEIVEGLNENGSLIYNGDQELLKMLYEKKKFLVLFPYVHLEWTSEMITSYLQYVRKKREYTLALHLLNNHLIFRYDWETSGHECDGSYDCSESIACK